MKRPMFIMTALLVIFCLIYSYTNVEAKESINTPVKVVDFETGDDTEAPADDTQSSQSSAETFIAGEGAASSAGTESPASGVSGGLSGDVSESTSSGSTSDSSGNSSGGNIFNGQSGKDAADELLKGSEPDILGEDYKFGDDILQTDETTEGFFQHIYNKTWEAFTGLQKIFTVIVLFCFIVSAIMTLISIFGKKEKVLWYAFSMLLCLIILLCIIYAPQIAAAFNKWFVTT